MSLRETLKNREEPQRSLDPPTSSQSTTVEQSELLRLRERVSELKSKLQTSESNNAKLNESLQSERELNKLNSQKAALHDEAQAAKDKEAAEIEKARTAAARDRQAAARERADAQAAKEREAGERAARNKAEKAAKGAQNAARRDREKSGHLSALSVAGLICAAFLLAYEKIYIFLEVGRWFADRWGDAASFFVMTWGWQRGGAEWFTGWTTAPGLVGNILFFLIYVALNAAAVYGVGVLFAWAWGRYFNEIERDHKMHWWWFAMVFCFYVCLYFYDWIKSWATLNIFSVWLIAALMTAAAFYGKDIAKRAKQGY